MAGLSKSAASCSAHDGDSDSDDDDDDSDEKEAELKGDQDKLDADGDGKICAEELKNLIAKVGGEMADTEANALINAADLDGNLGIDFAEFSRLWEALHDESEVSLETLDTSEN